MRTYESISSKQRSLLDGRKPDIALALSFIDDLTS